MAPAVEQDLVVHVFALPGDPAADRRLRELWRGCRDTLGMTSAIPRTGLPVNPPRDLSGPPADAALAAMRDASGRRQCVLRTVGGFPNLSLAFTGTSADSWSRAERLWAAVAEGRTGTLLGEARLYLARDPGLDGGGAVVVDASRARELAATADAGLDGAPRWWERGSTAPGGFALWESTAGRYAASPRRFLIVAPGSRDREVSAWLWSDGGVAAPPFARYLLNAAKVRHQMRLWEEAHRPRSRTDRLTEVYTRIQSALTASTADEGDPHMAERHLADLRRGEAELVAVAGDLADMREAVEAAAYNIRLAVPTAGYDPAGQDPAGQDPAGYDPAGYDPAAHDPAAHDPVGDDLALAEWLTAQLDADIRALAAGRERVARLAAIAAETIDRAGAARRKAPASRRAGAAPSRRNVFVVHGRDDRLRAAMFDFLRALDLRPLEWETLVRAAGNTAPFLGDVVAQAPAQAQAALVILSPDDVVRLHPALHTANEHDYEVAETCQPRPNVLLELGMVLAAYPERTVIVEVGRIKQIADLAGRNVIRFDGSVVALGKVAERLKAAGCAVDDSGSDWRDPARFSSLDAYSRGDP